MDPVLSGPCCAFGVISPGDSVWILAAVAALSGLVALHYQRRLLHSAAEAAARARECDALSRRATHAEAENLRLTGLLASATVAAGTPGPAPAGDAVAPSPAPGSASLARLLDPIVRQIVSASAESAPAASLRQALPLLQETTARAFLLSRGAAAAVDADPGLAWLSLNSLVTAEVERRRSGHDAHTRLAVFLEPGLPVLPLAAESVARILARVASPPTAEASPRSLRIRTSMAATETGPAQRLEIASASPDVRAPSLDALAAAAGVGATAALEPTAVGWTAVILWPSPEKPAPTAEVPAPRGPSVADSAPAAPSGRRVLLAEDDPFVARGVSAALRRGGHRVTCATDGTAALALLRLDPAGYDVVFTDLNMPGVGGRDLLVALNRDGVRVPVVVLSGYITSAIFDELQQLGVARILRKPVRIEDLLAAVEQPHELLDPAASPD